MKKLKYTPGPWKVERHNGKREIWSNTTFLAALDSPIFLSAVKNKEVDGNAYLMAAAPKMFEALEKFAHDLEALRTSTDEADYPLEVAHYIETYLAPIATETIAKARGKS